MKIRIALAGNPNSGKTTLFNALTGSHRSVGNWPGVTVEKKEGYLKDDGNVIITDLPGIYSLSPYTPEEKAARDYLINERPDAILNIIDGTNPERNLYLTTQLAELGIPMVCAVNMMDEVEKNGDVIDTEGMSKAIGCKVTKLSALKGTGVAESARAAIRAAGDGIAPRIKIFPPDVESALVKIENTALATLPEELRRWFAVKLFERDADAVAALPAPLKTQVGEKTESIIKEAEKACGDDSESIITNGRYTYIESLMKSCRKKKSAGKPTVSERIDRVLTGRFTALPVFVLVMFAVYFLSVSTVGAWAADWASDGLFGAGWHLYGGAEYREAAEEYAVYKAATDAFEAAAAEAGLDPETAVNLIADAKIYDEEGRIISEFPVTYDDYIAAMAVKKPNPADYGLWIPGAGALVSDVLDAAGCTAESDFSWMRELVLGGVVGGVGSVLSFVPQLTVLFLLLSFLESCGYMARIAFILDRIFRRFGLSGRSFIPMLVGTGCGVPGIMASRTIKNERDRRMTVMTTTFMPCGAKLPMIALMSGALFGGAWWVAPSAYFMGVASIALSGAMLKKTRLFSGEPAPFVMELPAYRLPSAAVLFRSAWERVYSFIKKAGTVIFLSVLLLWLLQRFGFENGKFVMVNELDRSVLAAMGNAVAWIFGPLGFGNWESAAAVMSGLVAKENIVGTFGVLFGGSDGFCESSRQLWENMRGIFTPASAYSFLAFNLLCAPCFAAMNAIAKEMNSARWTLFAIGYQCAFAYAVSLIIYQFASLASGNADIPGAVAATLVSAVMIFMLFRPYGGHGAKRRQVRLK